MKITKRQLRRIIKEEKRKVLHEQHAWKPGAGAESGAWYDAINDLIYSELGASGGDIKTDGRSIIEALENLRRDIQDELGAGPLPMGVE